MYQLTASTNILRLADNAFIPAEPTNIDYQEYLDWLSKGNKPLPYVPPEPIPETNWPSLVFSITNDDSFNLVWELANSKKPLIASSLITSFNNVASGGLETFKHFFNEVCLLGEASQTQRDNWATLAESLYAPDDLVKVIKGI